MDHGSINDVVDIIAADHVGRRIAKAHHKKLTRERYTVPHGRD